MSIEDRVDRLENASIEFDDLFSQVVIPAEKEALVKKYLPSTKKATMEIFPASIEGAFLLTLERLGLITFEQESRLEVIRNQYDDFIFERSEYIANHPVSERSVVSIHGHTIEILSYGSDLKLDPEHLQELHEVLDKIYLVSPELVQNYLKIFAVNDYNAESKDYALNGENISRASDSKSRGIKLTQLGFNMHIEHRVGGMDNFAGTIVHEIGHALPVIFPEVINKWRKHLDYIPILKDGEVNDSDWQKITRENGQVGFKHVARGLVSVRGEQGVPKDLDRLPSAYAAFSPDEDLSDSFALYILNSDKLDKERKQFFIDLFKVEK